MLQARGVIGARLNRLDVTESQLLDLKTTLTAQKSDLEGVDAVDAASPFAEWTVSG
ncbi:MAG: flagellin [Myxococcota bacterium]